MLLDLITRARADAKDADPTDIDEPLERFVSTDAIRDLEAHDSDSWYLEFETRDGVVAVTGDGRVSVRDDRQRDPRG
jgi:hypothetical protein